MDYLKLTAKISYGTNSWTEIYNLITNDLAVGKRYAGYLMAARARILPVGFSIVRNPILSSALTKGDGTPVYGQYVSFVGEVLTRLDNSTPEANFTTEPICNDPNASFLFRIDCANGQYSYRHVRGLRDLWLADYTNQLSAAPTNYISPNLTLANTGNNSPYSVFNALTAPFTPADALGCYLSTIRDTCAIYNPTTAPPITDYNQHPYAPGASGDSVFQFQRASEKKAGKRYFRSRGRQRVWA